MGFFSFRRSVSPQKFGELLGEIINQVVVGLVEPDRLARERRAFQELGLPFDSHRYKTAVLNLLYRQSLFTMMTRYPSRAEEIGHGIGSALPTYLFALHDLPESGRIAMRNMNALAEMQQAHNPLITLGRLATQEYLNVDLPSELDPGAMIYFSGVAKSFVDVLGAFLSETKPR